MISETAGTALWPNLQSSFTTLFQYFQRYWSGPWEGLQVHIKKVPHLLLIGPDRIALFLWFDSSSHRFLFSILSSFPCSHHLPLCSPQTVWWWVDNTVDFPFQYTVNFIIFLSFSPRWTNIQIIHLNTGSSTCRLSCYLLSRLFNRVRLRVK